MAKATDLVFFTHFWPFCISQCVQCMLRGLFCVLLCVPFIPIADSAWCQFVVVLHNDFPTFDGNCLSFPLIADLGHVSSFLTLCNWLNISESEA